MEECILCMDIGGTNIRAGMINKDYKIDNFTISESIKVFKNGDSISNLVDFISKYLRSCMGRYYPKAISIGFPATVDKNKEYIVSAPNVEGLDNVQIVNLLQKIFGIPVYIDKDVNMHIHYDIHELNLQSSGIIVACYLGTGFGNALWINNSVYTGYSGSAGELGHIPMLGKDDMCGCGNRGCIENYTGGKRLEFIRKTNFPSTEISKVFELHGDDPVLDDFVRGLSIPIAGEINILDPECVIIGGGIVQMKEFPIDRLEHYIRLHTRKPYPYETLRIEYSIQKQENGVIGAGIYAFKELYKRKDEEK